MNPFQSEPAVSAGVVMAFVTVAVAFGAPISEEQKRALQDSLPIILPAIGALVVWIRQMVVPVPKAEQQEAAAFTEGWDTAIEATSAGLQAARTGGAA